MDAEAKKRALRLFTYGLYVMTAANSDEVAAGTINWVSQASFTPPLIMVGVKADSHLHQLVEQSGLFALNILGHDQKAMAQDFFKPSKREGMLLNGHPFTFGQASHAPVFPECPATVEAKLLHAVKAGDHTVFVAEVVEAEVRQPEAKPLEMWDTGWFYGG
jgi:flavin reductase (DIM6/NTAB) family NADH-FMN oxidoreductase RutF